MRYLIAVAVILAALAGSFLVYRQMTAGPAVVLPVPKVLQVTTSRGAIVPGGWANAHAVSLKAQGTGSVVAGMDVELRRQGVRFTGKPTTSTPDPGQVAAACTGCVDGAPSLTVRLADGTYHWQARLHNKQGISPWRRYAGMLNVDTRAPLAPSISSSTNPDPSKPAHTSTLKFAWRASDSGSGVSGFSYRLDTNRSGAALPQVRTREPAVTLTGLDTGSYYFHVRTVDKAGNWGPSATYPVRVDVTPPSVTHIRFSAYDFNPSNDSLGVSFGVTKPAKSIHVGIYRQDTKQLVRYYTLNGIGPGQTASVDWHGRNDRGAPVPAGTYMVYVRVTDQYGFTSLAGWRDFIVNYDRIVVSLSQQKLTAYENGKVFLTTLVTTGNRKLPTPAGSYHILAKLSPYTFISPWPKSSPFYYKPSKSKYAMLFRDGGYFLHDAPWRQVFGPGSNSQLGTPGGNYTGTHGCVNIPFPAAQKLFKWAPIGTEVQVVP